MRSLAAITLVALATAGCIGSSAGGTGRSTDQGPVLMGIPPTKTDLMITYTVPTCPPGARCVAVSANQNYFIVSRQLTCSPAPAEGNYPDPAAACHALTDLVTKYDQNLTSGAICACPGHPVGYVYPKAVGYYNGERRTIPLDICALCQIPGLGADLARLLPRSVG